MQHHYLISIQSFPEKSILDCVLSSYFINYRIEQKALRVQLSLAMSCHLKVMKSFRSKTFLSMLQFYTDCGKVIDKNDSGKMQDCPGNLRGYYFKHVFCFHNIRGIMKSSRKQDYFMHRYTDNLPYNPVLDVKQVCLKQHSYKTLSGKLHLVDCWEVCVNNNNLCQGLC